MANPLGGMFEMPAPQQSTRQRIGQALTGFGRGVRGEGAEYVEFVKAQEEALSNERQQAMVQDALAVDSLLAESNVEDAMSLMNRRFNLIKELGGDPTDTVEVMQLVAQGRVPEARQLIGGFLGQAEAAGIYQRPKQEEFTLSPGDVRFRGSEQIAAAPVVERPVEMPAPMTDAGKLRRDLELGYISPEQFSMLSQQMTAQPEATPLEQVQLRRAEVELANAEQTGQTKAAETTERNTMVSNELIRAYELANNLRNRPGLSGAVGPIQGRMPVFNEAKADARADLKELGNLLTMANLGRMTGVLSESDIRLIASAASGLDETASDARAIEKLNEIVSRLGSNPKVAEYLANQSGQPSVAEGTVIVNQQTGERRVMRNGTWEPI
jgi:hypothetical protein